MSAGHSGQFTPMRLPVNTVIHTTSVGLEPTTFRSLVRRATSSATEPTNKKCSDRPIATGNCTILRIMQNSFVKYMQPTLTDYKCIYCFYASPLKFSHFVYFNREWQWMIFTKTFSLPRVNTWTCTVGFCITVFLGIIFIPNNSTSSSAIADKPARRFSATA